MLSVHRPAMDELRFKQMMMADEQTMSYNHAFGGTIPFPEERWTEWYSRWIVNNGNKRYYRYLKNADGIFVGEISYHHDSEMNVYMADVVMYSEYRGRGYGRQALDMLCNIAKENGITELYDEIAADNPSIRLFLRHGFSEESRTENTVILKKIL